MAAPGGTGAAADRAAGTAGVVVNALEELGHALSAAETSAIRSRLAAKEKGELESQCVGALVTAILYFGRAFKEDEAKGV